MQSTDSGSSNRLLDKYWEPFATTVAADLVRYRPKRVLVDIRKFEPALPLGEEILALFMPQPEFERAWREYQRVGEVAGYRIYRRKQQDD